MADVRDTRPLFDRPRDGLGPSTERPASTGDVSIDLGEAAVRSAVEEARSATKVAGLVLILVLVGAVVSILGSVVAFVVAGSVAILLRGAGAGDGIVGLAFGATMLMGTLGPAFLAMLLVYRRLPKPLRLLGATNAVVAAGRDEPGPGQRILQPAGTAVGFVVGVGAWQVLANFVGDGSVLLFALPIVGALVASARVVRVARAGFWKGGIEGLMGASVFMLLLALLAFAAGD